MIHFLIKYWVKSYWYGDSFQVKVIVVKEDLKEVSEGRVVVVGI